MTALVDFPRWAAFWRVMATAATDPRDRATYLANAVACDHPERLSAPITLPHTYQPNMLAPLAVTR